MNFTSIDFARRRQRPRWGVPAGLLLLVLAAWGGYRCWETGQRIAEARAALTAERQKDARRAAAAAASLPVVDLPKEQLESINEAVTALNRPWPALLGAIEAARPNHVALVRVEPRTQDRVVLITARAVNMGLLVDYMAQMARTPPFVKVTPVRQDHAGEGEQLRKQATFEASWEAQP